MNPLKLPFDQYQRYRVACDAIEAVREEGEKLTVLDVGGSPGLALDFLPKDRVFVIDRTDASKGPFIRGDGTAMPFRDRAFDVVMSVDVLEHIAPERRETFLNELKRVSKRYVFIAAPFRSDAVVEAERVLYDVIKAASGEEHAFLKEHLEHGLPEESGVRETLEGDRWETLSIPNGALKRWLPMMALMLYMIGDENLRDIAGRVSAFYNSNYYEDDNREPSYRRLVGAARGGFPQGAAEKIAFLASGEKDEKGLDLSWLSLFITLFGYRDLKKARHDEREEFKKVIEARDNHIESLKETVTEKDRRIKRQKDTIEGQKKTIEALRKRLETLERSPAVKALKGIGVIKKTGK